jgi:hypothetical protein
MAKQTMYTRLHKYVTYPYGGKFVNTAATCLNAVFFVLYNGVGEKTDRKEYKKNNFDMPLQ